MLLQAFTQALANPDQSVPIVETVRSGIANTIEQNVNQKRLMQARLKDIKARRGKVKVKKGKPNIVWMLIDQEVGNIERGFEAVDHQIEVLKLCQKALEAYSENVPEPKQQLTISLQDLMGGTGNTSTWNY